MKARAVTITGAGGVDCLSLGDIDVRDPGPGEIRVAVAAAGLNRADVLQRKGFYPAPPGAPADIPGLEYAGTVEAVGPEAGAWAVGDRVMGIVAGGGMATHLVVHAREALPVPEGLDLDQAAAIPEVFLTAYDALRQADLRPGETLLIHSAGSGVGTAAIQLAALWGVRTVGTSRTPDKLARCQALGLDHAVVPEGGAFAKAIRAQLGGRGADVILDTIGGAYLAENVATLATQGRLVIIGLLGGATAPLPLGLLLARRARVMGTVLRSRPLEEKAALAQEVTRTVLGAFAAGRLRPVVDTVLPMAEVRAAHARMEANETFGKIVLRW